MINHFQGPFFVTPSSALQVIKGTEGWNRIQTWEQKKLPDWCLQIGRENIHSWGDKASNPL